MTYCNSIRVICVDLYRQVLNETNFDKDSLIENKERNTGQLIHTLEHKHLYYEKECENTRIFEIMNTGKAI